MHPEILTGLLQIMVTQEVFIRINNSVGKVWAYKNVGRIYETLTDM